jgi:hypothetical protein
MVWPGSGLEVVGMLATDPLSLVFLGCILFSGTFLLISMVTGLGNGHGLHLGQLHLGHAGHVGHFGHAGNAGHVGDGGHAAHATNGHAGAPATGAGSWAAFAEALVGSLNLFSLLTLLFCFGLLGYVLHNLTPLGDVLALVFPAAVGIGAGVGVGAVMRRLFEANSGVLTLEDTRLEGRIGKVSLTIRPGGIGEVIFERAGGGRQSIGARSLDGAALAVDTDIVIVSINDGIAAVQGWESFLRGVHGGAATPLAAIEPTATAPQSTEPASTEPA